MVQNETKFLLCLSYLSEFTSQVFLQEGTGKGVAKKTNLVLIHLVRRGIYFLWKREIHKIIQAYICIYTYAYINTQAYACSYIFLSLTLEHCSCISCL